MTSTNALTTTIVPTTAAPSLHNTTNTPIMEPKTTETGSIFLFLYFSPNFPDLYIYFLFTSRFLFCHFHLPVVFLLELESTNDTNNESGTKSRCKAPGNPRCNPESWDSYGGYSDGCCSEEEKCTINEGDCNLDTECYGSLVCMPNSCPIAKNVSRKFHKRASCCQQPSGTYKLGTHLEKFSKTQCFLLWEMLF